VKPGRVPPKRRRGEKSEEGKNIEGQKVGIPREADRELEPQAAQKHGSAISSCG